MRAFSPGTHFDRFWDPFDPRALSNPITQTRISDINDTVEIKSTEIVLYIPIRDGTSIPCIAGIPQYLEITLQTLKLVGSTLRG